MLDHVLAPNVEDDRQLGLESDDVREILLGTHAWVHVARLDAALQPRNHVLKLPLVRKKIVRTEVTARFRDVVDELPEFLIAEPVRNALGARRRGRNEREQSECGDETAGVL